MDSIPMIQDYEATNNDSDSRSVARGMYHCKEGQEAVHELILKTQELFNFLKNTGTALHPSPEEEKKKTRVKDYLNLVDNLFKDLRQHYNVVNEVCSSLSYVKAGSLIPYKDDPDGIEQIQKHTRSLQTDVHPDRASMKRELIAKIEMRDEQLAVITNDLRNLVYEINTLLHASKSSTR